MRKQKGTEKQVLTNSTACVSLKKELRTHLEKQELGMGRHPFCVSYTEKDMASFFDVLCHNLLVMQ